MPVRSKTYSIMTTLAGGSVRPLPEAPGRKSLFIQNTGGVPGRLRFGSPCQGGASDVIWPAGVWKSWEFPDTCPVDSVNLASDQNCTWVIIEGVSGDGRYG